MKTETDVMAATSAAPAEALPDFATMDRASFDAYMKTGDLPKENTENENADATKEPGQDAAGKSGAASDAADKKTVSQDPPKPNREERRNQKLANENRDLKARLEALEKAQQAKPADERRAASSDALKKPRIKDYPDTDEGLAKWEDDTEAYYDAKTDARLAKERESRTQEEQQKESAKTVDGLSKTFSERAKEYRKTLKTDTFAEDFVEVNAFINDRQLGYLADALVESEVGPQFITYFGEHFDELEKLAAMTPTAALRELGRLEVSEKIKGPAPKTRTAARKIGSEVRGSAPASDEDAQLEEAARTGDQKTYNRIMAKREAAETRR